MPESAREHTPAGADDVAAGGISDRRLPQRTAIAWPRLRTLWPRRSLARVRLLMRPRPVERSLPVRNLVTLLGGIIAVVLALSIPIGYGIIGYLKEGHALTYKAELSAARAAQYIYAPDAPWRYDTDQLAAISEIRTTTTAPIVQRILDKEGAAMMQKGDPLPWPTFARRAPIFAAGAKVGMAEVSASMRPLLTEVFSVGLGSLALAIAAYFAFARLPLGALDRTLDQLKTANARFKRQNLLLDTALENMGQGLAMFDAELRVVLANDRYAEIYGLTPEQVQPGTTLQQVLEHRIANGSGCGKSADEMLQATLRRTHEKEASHYAATLADGRHIAVSLQRMADGGIVTTHQDITDQRRSEAKIVHMALHDALTDLPNRVLLNERLEHALARVRRGEMVAVHLLDLDHFKTVNDTLGHPTGDKLLKMVAGRLRQLVRETDTIARMGGDEFAVLQTAISQPADATVLALRIIETVSAPFDLDGTQVVIGTSVGIAVGPSDGTSPDQLIRNADLALYRAKGDGRGTYRFFGPEMDAQMQVRRSMENDLRKALVAGEFELHYQPVVNLANDEISGVEALIRWRHPEKGLIPPNTFIPLAEEIGFIIPLGEWAIREACLTARSWPDDIKIAVNLSPVQFRNPGFLAIVVGALAASGLSAERLELEITEGMLLQDSEATLSTLYQLRALGVRIAMDDFGTGYSSLSYLQSFPFDKIKIDRSFVKDIADGVGSLNIVRAVAAMANGLGMTTTAEGVETKEQLDTVRAEGCTEMQGFLFSKPLPGDEIEQLLLAKRKPRAGRATGAGDAA